MKTYNITISQITKKNKKNKLHSFVINSEGDKLYIEDYYKDKYKCFEVVVQEVEEIEFIENKTQIKKNNSYLGSDYTAVIVAKDIENFEDNYKKIEFFKDKIKEIENKIENSIKNQLGYEKISCLKVRSYEVTFNIDKIKIKLNK